MSFKKKCLLMLTVLLGCLLLFGTAALADQSMSSAERPAGVDLQPAQPPAHQPSPVKAANGGPYIDPPVPDQSGVVGVPWSYTLHPHEKGGACGAQPRILLVEDADSWETGYQNEVVLNDLGLAYDKITSDQLASTDLYQYTHLLAPSDQPQGFYDNLDANMESITQWVYAGGSFQFNACDVGWAGGHWTYGPGGITHVYPVYVQQNYIQAPDHPILQGQDDSMFANWNYVSHGYFENLPEGTQVLLSVNPDGTQPTLVDFKLGKGHVVASQNTLEWTNAGAYGNPSNPLILDKIILYMFGAGFDCLQWSASDVDNSLMNVFIDPNTDVMKIDPLAVGSDDILLTLTDTGTGATAEQWVNVNIEAEDTTPPLLEVKWPEGCLPEPGPYMLHGRVERGAENVTVNGSPVQYVDYDNFWAYWQIELYLNDGNNPVTVIAHDQAQNEARIDGNICVGVPGTDLIINAPDDCIPVGQELKVAVEVKNVKNMYGADVRLYFDPYFLEVVGDPVINTDGVFSLGGTTTVDNNGGYVAFNASRNHDEYGYAGYDGDAVLAWITFRAKQPTEGNTTCINFYSAELVGNAGEEGSEVYDIPINNWINDCVKICGYVLKGNVRPEAMPLWQWPYYYDYSGTKVSLEGTSLVTYTDAYGNYSFFNPPAGHYNVVAERGGYLVRAVPVDMVGDVSQEVNILLLTGDIRQDNAVDIDDLNVMRTDYDTWWTPRSDLDCSGWVGIRDLVYLARNYTKYGYGYLMP